MPVETTLANDNIVIRGARTHNLKNVDVQIPLGCFVAVTGVSGSGKSTLIQETLYPRLMQHLHSTPGLVGAHDEIVLPAVSDATQITTKIADISGALFSPKTQAKVIDAGKPITFTWTLANSGSIPQSYTLGQAGAPGGWISTLTPAITRQADFSATASYATSVSSTW